MEICLHRVLSLILQLIRPQLVKKPDAAPLLEEIEQDTFPFVGDLPHGSVELGSTVATSGRENVACKTLRVNPNKRRFLGADLSHDESHMLLTRNSIAVAVDSEVARIGRQSGPGHPFNEIFIPHAIGNEVSYGEDAETVLAGKLLQPGQTGHLSVVVHDLAQHTRGCETGHSGQVDRRFGVSGAFQNSTGLCPQGEHVARPLEIGRPGFRIDYRLHSGRTVVG